MHEGQKRIGKQRLQAADISSIGQCIKNNDCVLRSSATPVTNEIRADETGAACDKQFLRAHLAGLCCGCMDVEFLKQAQKILTVTGLLEWCRKPFELGGVDISH